MNPRGILMLVLLVVIGSGRVMCQIEAGSAIQLTIKRVPADQKPKFDPVYPVSEEGMVILPLVGKVKASGKTPVQLARDIENAYISRQIFAAPKIQVYTQFAVDPVKNNRVIYIAEQARRTRRIDFVDGMTIGDAIKAAGSSAGFGTLSLVTLYRDGEKMTYDLTKKENLSIPIIHNDTVEMPQKAFLGR